MSREIDTSNWRFLIIPGLMLVGGYVAYRVILAELIAVGMVSVAPAKPAPRPVLDLGPYPFVEVVDPHAEANRARYEKANPGPRDWNVDPVEPQDVDNSWSDPVAAVKRQAKHNQAAQGLRQKVMKESGGEPEKVLDVLFERSKEAEGAQALFESMKDLAQGGTGFKIKEGENGIAVVARLAKKISTRFGTKEMGHFDGPLMEEAIKLMAFHGAPPVPEANLVPKADGTGKVPPIDPVVRGVLRIFLNVPDLQGTAAKALGHLRDAETAKEIIENPGKYGSASISDFGPEAVAQYKIAQKNRLQRGATGGDGAFWQGVRLAPRDQDVAVDLALAGDGGAALAMERNFVVMAQASGDPDAWMAKQIDTVLRFPGTRAALVAREALFGIDRMDPFGSPKTFEMVLRALDHDFSVMFGTKPWGWEDLAVLFAGPFSLTGLWHTMKYKPVDALGQKKFYPAVEALFRKHYRKTSMPKWEGDLFGSNYRNAQALSLFARHLKLDAIEYPMREKQSELRGGYGTPEAESTIEKAESKRKWNDHPEEADCIKAGHIKNFKDY